jgi:hypothetical protein
VSGADFPSEWAHEAHETDRDDETSQHKSQRYSDGAGSVLKAVRRDRGESPLLATAREVGHAMGTGPAIYHRWRFCVISCRLLLALQHAPDDPRQSRPGRTLPRCGE